jgi:hypothetical protein
MIATLTFGSRAVVASALLFALMLTASPSSQGQTTTFTLYSADAKRSVIVRNGNPEMVALEQLTNTFGLTFTEDRVANGVVIGTRGERILAIPGQSFVRTAGRVVQLNGPVQRERNTWIVPLDFLTKALAPAINESIVIRRSSKLILVGSIRVPEVGGHVERTAGGAKVVIAAQPATPYKVTRDGNRLTVRFEAVALDGVRGRRQGRGAEPDHRPRPDGILASRGRGPCGRHDHHRAAGATAAAPAGTAGRLATAANAWRDSGSSSRPHGRRDAATRRGLRRTPHNRDRCRTWW